MKGQKDQFRSSIGGGGVLMESNDVLMVPYSVLDGPIVLNIHVGPIPRLAGIGRSNGGTHSDRHSNLRSM